MTGFGSNSFGQVNPFGSTDWYRIIGYDYLPSQYRVDDEAIGYPLLKYIRGTSQVYQRFIQLIANYHRIKDPAYARSQEDNSRRVRLGVSRTDVGEIIQRGFRGDVEVGTFYFRSQLARFTPDSIGKVLYLKNPIEPANLIPATIITVISETSVLTDPVLTPESGPLVWELREPKLAQDQVLFEVQDGDVQLITPSWILDDGQSEFQINQRQQFRTSVSKARLLIEREYSDGVINSAGNLTSVLGYFDQRDVGKRILINSPLVETNRGLFTIERVLSRTEASLTGSLIRGISSDGGIYYRGVYNEQVDTPVRVRHVVSGVATPLSVDVVGTDITVHVATDWFGQVLSTASDVVTFINNDPLATAFVTAEVFGSGTDYVTASDYQVVRGYSLTSDQNVFFSIRARPELQIDGTVLPRGIVAREGVDAEVVSSGSYSRVRIPSGRFSEQDVDQWLRLEGSLLGNNGSFRINSVINASLIEVEALLVLESEELFWEVRPATSQGSTWVEVRPPSLLNLLAYESGVSLDENMSAARQRQWISQTSQWINTKGQKDSYRYVGTLQGFDVTAHQLWRVSQDYEPTILADHWYAVAYESLGLSGNNGTLLAASGGRMALSSPSALFSAVHVGDTVTLSGAGSVDNVGHFQIDEVVSPQHVIFRVSDGGTPPDANNGSIEWVTVRFYTDLAPLIPLHDEFNADYLEEYIEASTGTKHFHVDKFCWEEGWTSTVPVTISAVTSLSSRLHELTLTRSPFDIVRLLPNPGPQKVPLFKITDSAGIEFFIETYPEAISGVAAKVRVDSLNLPALGAGTLEYICSEHPLDCGYCPSNKVLIKAQAAGILEEPESAQQRMFGQIKVVLESEAKPVHVDLLYQLGLSVQAGFGLGVWIDTEVLTLGSVALVGTGALTDALAFTTTLITITPNLLAGIGYVEDVLPFETALGISASLVGSGSVIMDEL